MLTYTFSRREKALILALAIVLLVIVWYTQVFQRTADEMSRIDSEIATVQSEQTMAQAKVAKMRQMEATIKKYEEEGAVATPMPSYDNMTPLMNELNNVMGSALTYSLAFDKLDTEASKDYVLRGVRIDYSCDSVAAAEAIVRSLARGTYPCSVDSVTIADSTVGKTSRVSGSSGSGPVSASVHVSFFEKR